MNRFTRATFLIIAVAAASLTAIPARADLIFTRQDNSYANTALGIIQGASAPVSPLISNMGGNAGQGIYPFVNADGKFRTAVTLYTSNGTDVINIYNPGEQSAWATQSAWKAPLYEAVTTLHNTRTMVAMGGSLYATAYDIPIVSKISTGGDVYKQSKKYEYTHLNDKYNGHGEALVAYNNSLYAIFTGVNDPWDLTNGDYRLNELVKLDADLNFVASADMTGKNLDGFTPGSYCVKGNTLYVATLGGVQQFGEKWNPGSCIEAVNLDTMAVSQLVSADAVNKTDPTFKHMFDAVLCVGDKIYIQAAKWTSKDDYTAGYDIRIYETTAEKLKKGDIGVLLKKFVGSYGYRLGLVHDEKTGYLWAGVGYSLWRYDGSSWTEYGSNALSGNIAAYVAINPAGAIDPIAPTPTPSGGESSGGGGCSATGFGLFSFLTIVPLLKYGRKSQKG
ncbi:MAG: hypothetical protein RRY12_03785 [Cloacibacillus sp.]